MPLRSPSRNIDEILQTRVRALATTLRPHTVENYYSTLRRFLDYLHAAFPRVSRLSQLRRDPHMLGWFRHLCEQNPPLGNAARAHNMIRIRRLFRDLAAEGYSETLSELILSEDLPRLPLYLPRPLSPQDDQLLQQELRRTDDLYSNALLLMRATGIRIGECSQLRLDCLRPLSEGQWALHVPVGKLYTERWIPADEEVRRLVARILALRAQAPAAQLARSAGWLLPRRAARLRTVNLKGDGFAVTHSLYLALPRVAQRAGCSHHVNPHQLRHTFATEMLRLGISLPALMQLMGHKDVRMTLRYVQITQQDVRREFQLARQNAAHRHYVPQLPVPNNHLSATSDLPGVRRSLEATRHLLEMYRRQLQDEKARRKLQRLNKRLLAVAHDLDHITPPEK